jgi:hypothetical protein
MGLYGLCYGEDALHSTPAETKADAIEVFNASATDGEHITNVMIL